MKHTPVSFRALGAFFLCTLLSVPLSAQTAAEDFEDGSLSPFNVEVIAGNVSEIVTPYGFSARAGTDHVLQAIPAGAWYDVRVAVRPVSNQADIYVNNVLKQGNQTLRNPTTAVDRVIFATSDLSSTSHLHIDKITVK
ncbi:MAG TPA: hypothetical protein VIO38_01335 [Rariglobus sp.]